MVKLLRQTQQARLEFKEGVMVRPSGRREGGDTKLVKKIKGGSLEDRQTMAAAALTNLMILNEKRYNLGLGIIKD